MPAVAIEGSNLDKLDLIHRCENCEFTRRNKIAPDDNRQAIIDAMKPPQRKHRG